MAKRRYSSKKKNKKRNSFISNLIKYLILLILAILVIGYLSFRGWDSKQNSFIEENSIIVNTSMGPIEYMSRGEGPIILLSHMEGSGADNFQIFDELINEGYQLICPSRPGYLNTPINKDADFKYQAEMFAELLQYLNIHEKVIVIGLAVGGPAAIEFANKYADKTSSLILINSTTGVINPATNLSQFLKFNEVPLLNPSSDIASWLDFNFAKFFPKNPLSSLITTGMKASDEIKTSKTHELIAAPNVKDDLLKVLKYTSPGSQREAGLDNDLKNLKNYQFPSLKARIPKLVIHSKTNGLIKVEHANNFKKSNSNCELFTYDGYGHAFWLSKDLDQINQKVLSFLKNKNATKPLEEPEQTNSVTGHTWVNNSDGALLHLKRDGSFSLDFPSVDSQRFYEGTFSIADKQISFTYNHDVELCSGISGVYQIKILEDKLELKSLNDKCNQRKQHFSQGWFRVD